ncbi:hypothetical protein BV20DRAFT_989016 [Pilatotrama ljubarskyi]|nr:hypothetical protein BV20DRAFT_989016 [Pilatotrama ljubarskyi]
MSSNVSVPLVPPVTPTSELTATFGVLLIGFIFTVTLYGLTFFQTYIYYTRFPADQKATKYIVGLLWAVDTAVTTLLSHTIYRYLITDFMIPFSQLMTTRTFIAEEALSVFLALVVQCYYAFRIWTVSGRRPLIPLLIVILAMGAFAFDLASAAQMTNQSLFAQVVSKSVKLTKGICWGLSVAADILIATLMHWYLRPSRYPEMTTPEGWYETVVVYGVNRGVFFAIFQTTSLVTLVTMPNQQVWILFHWVGSKIYINSILSMLNFRNTHRGRGVPEESSVNQHARGSSGRTGTYTSRSGGSAGPLETSHSVHFNVHADAKSAPEPMNIELDIVRSQGEDRDDDGDSSKKAEEATIQFVGPSRKRHDLRLDSEVE